MQKPYEWLDVKRILRWVVQYLNSIISMFWLIWKTNFFKFPNVVWQQVLTKLNCVENYKYTESEI